MANKELPLSIVLVNENDPSCEVFIPSDQLPFPMAAQQIGVGLCIDKPNCVDNQPILLIKSACETREFGKPTESALVYVSEKDELLKTKDTDGEVTAWTPFSFGAYNIPTGVSTSILPTLTIAAGSINVISSWSTISKKKFSRPTTAGFIKYKSHLHRAVKVDVSVTIPPITVAVAGPINLVVIKNGSPALGGEQVQVSGSGTLAAVALTVPIILSGTTIFKNVKHGDYFAAALVSGGIVITATFTIPAGSISLVALPKGKDDKC